MVPPPALPSLSPVEDHAGSEPSQSTPDRLHWRLAVRNERRLRPVLSGRVEEGTAALADELRTEMADRLAEEAFITGERRQIAALMTEVPTEASAFMAWFEGLRQTGPGQNDSLFPWLAERATLTELTWFLGQEVAGEAGFDDLLALAQLQMPDAVKLEMARNFWDEMGRGRSSGMHGPMLAALAEGLTVRLPREKIVWESQALSNLMVALAWNRHYAYQAIGALGVIEMTAPGRSAQVNAGLRRLGVSASIRKYFALHATLDVQHSTSWNREVLLPLVSRDPDIALAIAEGALLRLTAGARCFQRYRRALGPIHPRHWAPAPGANHPSS